MKWSSSAFVSLCSALYVSTAYGQGVPITLRAAVPFTGKPDRSYIAVADRGEIVAVSPAITSQKEGEGLEVVGKVLLPRRSDELTALFFVTGATAGTGATVTELSMHGKDTIVGLSRDVLRRVLDERAAEVRKREAQIQEQGQSLKRLQSDTDTIVEVERIVAAEDSLDKLKVEVARLRNTLEVVTARLEALKNWPLPTLARRREAHMSAELNVLSIALKSTEADALKRVSSASQELQGKLALIEATKNEHIDLLQNELNSLTREREGLESSRK